jgi:long-chain acyl-CoA synthetase
VGAESLDLTRGYATGEVALYTEPTGLVPVEALRAEVDGWRRRLAAPGKLLVRVDRPRDPAQLPAYLAALVLGHAVLPVDGATPVQAAELDESLRPDLTVASGTVRAGAHRRAGDPVPHRELALLLPTSGSTGRRKVVRLSYRNLLANAEAIAAATGIRPSDRVATSLPMDFALGLSLVHSHLVAGASVAVGSTNPVTRRFWYEAEAAGVTTVGLVPAAVRTLLAWSWTPVPGHLRTILLSGGPLDAATTLALADLLEPAGAALVRMYGQAEATARITCLPPELLRAHPESAGRVVPGHRLRIRSDGEIEYVGPSVMMGYGWDRRDLVRGDEQHGTLRTGDRGRLQDGLLWVEGRVDRQVKVLGRRVDLDLVETAAAPVGVAVAALPHGDDRMVLLVEDDAGPQDADLEIRQRAAQAAGLPLDCVAVRRVARLPRTGSNKIAYSELRALS